MEEINDFIDTIVGKMESLSRSIDRMEQCSKNSAEWKKLLASCKEGKYGVAKIDKDIKGLQYDLKRLPKDREQEYTDRLVSLKAKLNKLQRRLDS